MVEDYAALEWAHMRAEEDQLLPIAERALSAEDWEAINLAFRENDNPLFGIKPKELGFGAELVSARNVLDQLGVEPPPETPPAPPKRPRKPEGLPMPKPLPKNLKVEELEKEVVK